ncbi:MAG: hypothetical protein QOI50_7153, partial [Pseudonocardiales bacterium]|nr:hypothetical protein [Pseudonocardiales bacterium]
MGSHDAGMTGRRRLSVDRQGKSALPEESDRQWI